MKIPSIKEDTKKLAHRAAVVGAVLAILCNLLPPDYRAVCSAVANLCTGRL